VKVSKSEEYGLRLVMTLATDGGQLAIRELAEREGLPEATVAKVIGRLRRARLVEAVRGRRGGYTLSRPASDVTLAEVVAAFDDALVTSDFCRRMTPGEADCVRSGSCTLRPVWRGLTAVIGDFLSRITVADLISGNAVGAAPAFVPISKFTAQGSVS
jgi:Rrf2 family protein